MEDRRYTRVPTAPLSVKQGVGKRQVDVTEDQVRQWAEDVIAHELPGYYPDEVDGITFQVTHVGPDKFKVSGCYPLENEPREFLLHITVTEL